MFTDKFIPLLDVLCQQHYRSVKQSTKLVLQTMCGITTCADAWLSRILSFIQLLRVTRPVDSMMSVDPTRSWMKIPASVSAKVGFSHPAVDPTKNWTETRASVSVKTNFSPAHVEPTENLMKTHASVYVKEPVLEINR